MFQIDLRPGMAPLDAAARAARLRAASLVSLTRSQRPERNEDAFLAGRFLDETLGVCAVADGSGGSGAGREAARLAMQTMRRRVESSLLPQLTDTGFWTMLMHEIDGRLERDPRGGRTTLAVLVTDGVDAIVTSVGDSLVYRARGGAVSIVNDGARVSGLLGSDRITVCQRRFGVRAGDRLLLATDGLWKYLAFPLMARWLTRLPADDVLPHMAGELAQRFSGRIPDDATGVLLSMSIRAR